MQQTGHRFCFRCGFVAEAGEEICPEDGSKLNSIAADPYIGKTLADKYEVLEMLGRGGMSIVYKVRHLFMQRLEALKMLRVELVSDGDALQRFQQESKAICTLRHVNVVRVLDFGLLPDDTPFLTMEYLEGKDLGEVLKADGAFPPERAIPLFAQLCDGLFHAHQRGVIHRDIKPSNILISKDSNGAELPVIVDFGIAKLLASDGSTMHKLTSTGQVFGSPLYMSPEQCSSKRADERTDIYALGCVLYQTLTGVPPIQGNSPVETMMRQMQEAPRPFVFVKPNHTIPHAIELCVLKALAKDPGDRYRNMNEFRKALLKAAGLPYGDLPGANLPPDYSTASGGSSDQRAVAIGINNVDSTDLNLHDTGNNLRSTTSQFRIAREMRQDALAAEIGNEGLISRPLFQMAMALVIVGLIAIFALFFLPSSRPHLEDSDVEHAIEKSETEDQSKGKFRFADPNLAQNPGGGPAAGDSLPQSGIASGAIGGVQSGTTGEPQQIASSALPSSLPPNPVPITGPPPYGEQTSYVPNSGLSGSLNSSMKAGAAAVVSAQGSAGSLSDKATVTETARSDSSLQSVLSKLPACTVNLTDLGGDWRVAENLTDQLARNEPGSEMRDGTVYDISFHPDRGKDFERLSAAVTAPLVAGGRVSRVSELRMIPDAGLSKNIPVVLQTISYKKPDPHDRLIPRASYVIYFNRGGYVSALHIVPSRKANRSTLEFIRDKILPAFRLYSF
jgi:serine/threonine protein kinase